MRKYMTALILLALTFTAGCAASKLDGSGYPVYFLNQAEDGGQALKAESRELEAETNVVEGLLLALLEGPQREDLGRIIPASVSLQGWTLNNGLLTVDLSGSYGMLSGIDLTLADYSLVLTLTQLEEVEAVMITVEGEPLLYRDHQRLTAEDVREAILQEDTLENAE
ncbi:MAG: GerMN domain-containing protein [Ruminiclostridium sp.]|nr:GerMN domain-containing protein [Ruminiclostridium sp.]